jgi:hypothetical protein
MKRLFFLTALFISSALTAHPDMVEIRSLFSKAASDATANNELFSLTNSYNLSTFPVYYAYNAAAEMTLANHVSWPGTKLEHFNAGKERLESAVAKFPNNVEIRYIRYAVQQGCPFFLDYASNLEEDKKFILANISQTDWSESYKKQVREFLNKTA